MLMQQLSMVKTHCRNRERSRGGVKGNECFSLENKEGRNDRWNIENS